MLEVAAEIDDTRSRGHCQPAGDFADAPEQGAGHGMKPSLSEIRRRSTSYRIRMAQEPRKRMTGQTMFCNVCGQQPAYGVHNGVPWRHCGCDPYPSDPTPEDIAAVYKRPADSLSPSQARYRETSETAHIICDGNDVFLDEDIFRLHPCGNHTIGRGGPHSYYRKQK